jgi:hypothetical protein
VEFLQRHALAVDRRPEAVAYRLTANVGFYEDCFVKG